MGQHFSKAAQMADQPTLTTEISKLRSGGAKKYEYIRCVEFGVSTTYIFGLPRAKHIGLAK